MSASLKKQVKSITNEPKFFVLLGGQAFRLDKQPSKTRTKDENGSGLGLTLCKEFVEKLNGKIWVEREPDIGSDFKFTIPVGSVNL